MGYKDASSYAGRKRSIYIFLERSLIHMTYCWVIRFLLDSLEFRPLAEDSSRHPLPQGSHPRPPSVVSLRALSLRASFLATIPVESLVTGASASQASDPSLTHADRATAPQTMRQKAPPSRGRIVLT